jgi:ATP/maltotriose-dependent transcriptional regulator MalT
MRGRLETPFVGRTHELALLDRCLVEARRGEPRLVVLDGEAGIGKSTLLSHFIRSVPDAAVVRATGDEAESLLPLGVVTQLVAGTEPTPGKRGALFRQTLDDDADPVAVGNELVGLFHALSRHSRVVVVAIDDFHLTDRPSAIVLRVAMRRVRRIPLLALFACRPGQTLRLGEDWARFVSGDHRVTRQRLTGLARHELVSLAQALGAGRLSPWAAARLLQHTGGNPLHCCALLEELDPEAWTRPDRLPAPRALASLVLARLGKLSAETQDFVSTAAVLGRRCRLDVAAVISGLSNPVAALQEAVESGLLAETQEGPAAEISFTHALIQRAVYDDLGPVRRREIHHSAVPLVDPVDALSHRVAAAYGPDEALASDLESAATGARSQGRLAQAATWCAQSAAASATPGTRNERALAALELLVDAGQVAEADALLATFGDLPPSGRLSGLRGELDLLAGRAAIAKQRLHETWATSAGSANPLPGARAAFSLATTCMLEGRMAEAIEWGERAAAAAGVDPPLRDQALARSAVILVMAGRVPDGVARLGFIPSMQSEVPLHETELLVWRGIASVLTDDLDAAIADLTTGAARLHASGNSRSLGQCLRWLAAAEYRRGDWDDSAFHAEMAVTLAQDAARSSDLVFAHAEAARVPASRGDWAEAIAHVEASNEAAVGFGVTMALAAASSIAADLAWARGRPRQVVDSVSSVPAIGNIALPGCRTVVDARLVEIDALTSLGELDRAGDELRELEAAVGRNARASDVVTIARLRGNLAETSGDAAGAETAFRQGWSTTPRLKVPFELARLELDDGRRLRRAGRRAEAVERLRAARERLEGLRASPYLELCDRELASCGFDARAEVFASTLGLTRSEMAVAGLVAKGRSNREVAAELFLSVKTVEFHLRHVFSKLDIRGRRELAELMHT